MKQTPPDQHRPSQQQSKEHDTTPAPRQPAAGESASQKASEEARRGTPLPAENKRERSPKQENL